jgi:2-furoyl-CoA dehydrogenase large subunit
LGLARGSGRVTLEPDGAVGTLLTYRYEAAIGGKVAAVGGRLLDGAAKVVIGQFFAALAAHAGGGRERSGVIGRVRRMFRGHA